MVFLSGHRNKSVIATLCLVVAVFLSISGLSRTAAADMMSEITSEGLYMAIYVEELCGGKQFSQEQWARLVPRVRAMAGEGYTGEGELFTMMRAKNAALNITNLGQCWTAEAVAMRELFEIELSPAL